METIIALLNKAVAKELTAVHQYLYFHFHFNDCGCSLIADLFKSTAMEEMKHLDRLAHRILSLKGDIDIKSSGEIQKKNKLTQMLPIARKMEAESISNYKEWADISARTGDIISQQLFEELRADEERHFALFDAETKSIEDVENDYSAIY